MNPYEVLGVSEDADDETIKKAYRELIKKYHPDKYVNSPLADMASEKTKEINRAYDMINGKNTDNTQNQGYNPFGGGYRGYSSSSAAYNNVRNLITLGRILQAEQLLNTLPKTAEWYYLSGVIALRKGWQDRGIEYMKRAVEMEPNNLEYRQAYDNIINRNTSYTTRTTTHADFSPCCHMCPLLCIPLPCGCVPCYC